MRNIGHVDKDVVRRVAVQRSTEALLIEVVTNETDAATQHEEAVQGTNRDVLVSLFGSECTTIS